MLRKYEFINKNINSYALIVNSGNKFHKVLHIDWKHVNAGQDHCYDILFLDLFGR